MPNRKTHRTVGRISGGAYAAYAARNQPVEKMLIEIAGGIVGGDFGARIPDAIEPSIHYRHRSVAHSFAVGIAEATYVPKPLASWQQYCRSKAEQHEQMRDTSSDVLSRIVHTLLALFWHFLSGLAAGLLSGYISHLALDATTPRSLPLIA